MRKNYGYVRRRSAIREFLRSTPRPYLSEAGPTLRGTGENAQVRLVQAYEKVTGAPFTPHKQQIGSCVGHAYTLGAEILSCVEIAHGERERWKGKFCVEVTYGLSRVEIGGGRIRGDGSTGAWAARALSTFGLLLRGKYGKFDLSENRPDLAKLWGYRGVPDELELLAKEHPVQSAAICTSAQEAADAIASGYPVPVCSDQGFRTRTDREGFAAPQGTWYHAMLIAGVDSRSSRKGFEICNSWGSSWISGPKHKLGTAKGAFWADWNVVDRMLRQKDSHALSGFDGFPARRLDYILL